MPATDEFLPAADEFLPAADELQAADKFLPTPDYFLPAADDFLPAADEFLQAADEFQSNHTFFGPLNRPWTLKSLIRGSGCAFLKLRSNYSLTFCRLNKYNVSIFFHRRVA